MERGDAEQMTLRRDEYVVERLDLLSEGQLQQSGAGKPGLHDTVKNRGNVVDFEQLIRESLGSDLQPKTNQCLFAAGVKFRKS